MPVPPVGQVAATVGRPRHHMADARRDLLVAAGTAVRLVASGDVAHQPIAIGVHLHLLDTTAYPIRIERGLGVAAAVVAAG